MSAKILSGKDLALKIKKEIENEVNQLREEGIVPGLAVVIIGDNPASRIYVNGKRKMCAEVGIKSYEYALNRDCSEEEVISLINKLNSNKDINGILVQLPLPKHIDEDKIIKSINPDKDVDGFHPESITGIVRGTPKFIPCTPFGIIEFLNENNIQLEGKKCVVVGRSNIVGKPISFLLLSQNATVTMCHSKTVDLAKVTKQAEILVVAVGKPKFIKKDMVKEGAIVIDVGINRMEDRKIIGDVDFEEVKEVASAITPVPGGVGVMTKVMLMKNTVKAAMLQSKKV